MQSIRTTIRPPSRIRKWNELSQLRWTPTKVIPIENTTFQRWAKDWKKAASEEPTVLHIHFCILSNNSKYGQKVDLQRYRATSWERNFRTNPGSNFFGGSFSFSNRVNVRAPIHFRRKSQLQHLKKWFFLKNRPIHSHINNTSVNRLVKWNQLSFSSIEINKSLPAPVHSVWQIRFKFRRQF